MRSEPASFRLWLKRDLARRYGEVIREPVPDSLTALLDRMPVGN